MFEVLDGHLANSEWLGRDFSIADIANWGWVRTYKWSGISIEGLDHLTRWKNTMEARPACQKGVEVPFKLALLDDSDGDGNEASTEKKEFVKGAQNIVQK